MADTLRVLGQLAPAPATLSPLYTAPSEAAASTLVVCNTSGGNDTFRVSVAVAGAADNVKQYLYYDLIIQGNDTFTATIGITLAAADVVRVYSTNGTLSFNLFGVEVV